VLFEAKFDGVHISVYNNVYMRVNVFVTQAQLKTIDDYCVAHKLKRSNLLINSAMAYINRKGEIRCDYCGKPSIGRFKITVYNWESGESQGEKNLCEYHYGVARKEGEVQSI
jgi:hypothetical protein